MASASPAGILRYIRQLVRTDGGGEHGDRELLGQFIARRDEAAFAALLARHGPLVLAVCRQVLRDAHDAEDAFQATFLVLARKAASIRRHESLAAWLHRVALNVARSARAGTARRRAREREAALMPRSEPDGDGVSPEWQPLLHEEVSRLPAKYRVPVVLCYLEGKTHDETAHQLGWPLGTVKGRLARARDLLRSRLVRRGVALSASGLAVLLSRGAAEAAVPDVLAQATARAVLAGAAPAPVVALAEGVVRAMFFTRIKTVVLAVLAVAALGTGGGMLAYRTLAKEPSGNPPAAQEAKMPDPAPVEERKRTPADDFGPEVKGLRAKVTLAKNTFDVGEAVLVKYVVKNVSREEQTLWHSGFWPNHQVVVRDAAGKEPPLTEFGGRCRKAFSPGGERWKNVAVKVALGAEDAAYEQYDLTKLYDLSRPGRYTVEYVYEEKQGGWEGRLPSNQAAFEIAAKEDPRCVIEKDGVRFEVRVPERTWRIPERKPGAGSPVALGLRVTNKTDKAHRFSRFDTLSVGMVGPDGKALERTGGRSRTIPPRESDCPLLNPGEAVTFDIDARLTWKEDKLRFGGSDGFGGGWEFGEALHPGRYKVQVWYWNDRNEFWAFRNAERLTLREAWTGDVKTPYVEVSLAEPGQGEGSRDDKGMAESKPVEAQGLKFVALVEERVTPPPAGAERDFGLGLRVTNVSDKPLGLATFDVIRPRLYFVSGKRVVEVEMGSRRKDTPRLTPPVTLAPGASWTWSPEARLSWTSDRSALQLSGPDGHGIVGAWSFVTLKEGTYRLAVEYENNNPRQDDVALWVGKATTNELEFKIVAAAP
jgi:RNA polymerase sigma factor (sigma-70 family)